MYCSDFGKLIKGLLEQLVCGYHTSNKQNNLQMLLNREVKSTSQRGFHASKVYCFSFVSHCNVQDHSGNYPVQIILRNIEPATE